MFLIVSVAALLAAENLFAQWDKDEFFYRGRRALSEGRYGQAIENFNILSRLDSTDYWIFFFRGIAKYNLGDIRGANKDFNNSVRLNPVFTPGYHYRAITLSGFGKYEEALSDFNTAIGLRPGDMGIYFSRGVTYFLAQDFESAVSDFNRYIKKEPKDPGAYLNRGASYLFLADTLKALADYNKAISLNRFDPEGYIRRGRLYAAASDFDNALSDMNQAITLDPDNTFAYFNRALLLLDKSDYRGALSDMNTVLKHDPGNALCLYNRALLLSRVGSFEEALADMDRVININPSNVLAYFNRASIYIDLQRYREALSDYDKAIELYPDFAKAYLNRAYVENILGRRTASKKDYDTAQKKISQYRAAASSDPSSFADTTRKYSSLIAFDADFAKKDFNDELLQNRDINVRLQSLKRFALSAGGGGNSSRRALADEFENPLMDRFLRLFGGQVTISGADSLGVKHSSGVESLSTCGRAATEFLLALDDCGAKRYNAALAHLDKAVDMSSADDDRISRYYKAFYLMNRGVLKAEMIEFIASMSSNVQILSLDDTHNTTARVSDRAATTYDYSDATSDLVEASSIVTDNPYIFYNLGNLFLLGGDHISSIGSYTKAISLYPYMGEAYLNRALVQIYLKDKEKGCIDLSRAGELGIREAYPIIKKYCEENE
ncbi:MAG: tetratricopeptide repeat protein [Bacteroidales bacterium]|nr:tetratricopeptide repeat protein [Bacteroidales bacterium]